MPSDRISHTEITENLLSTEHTLSSLLQKFEPVRRSIIKPFPEARHSSAFSVKILLKILFAASLNYRLFLAKQHLKQDFLQRSLALAQPQNHPYKFRLNSDDSMIQALQYNNITVSKNDFLRYSSYSLQYYSF